MSWYQTPVQPFDPVVQSQTPKPPFRYIRDNFLNTGQDSYHSAPAQDQGQWQALTNVQPITQGILLQRWGYNQFASLAAGLPNRLYNFQSDAIGSRYLIATGPTAVQIYSEAGTQQTANLFTPTTPAVMRSITSRNYQYFCNGNNARQSTSPAGSLTISTVAWNSTSNDNLAIANVTGTNFPTPGQQVTVTGCSNPFFNGIFNVFFVSATTVSYFIPGTGSQSGTGGTITPGSLAERTGNSVKWNGTFTAPTDPQCVSNIGIIVADTTTNNTSGGASLPVIGPNLGSSASDATNPAGTQADAWTNVNGIYSTTGGAAAASNKISVTESNTGFIINFNTFTDLLLEEGFFATTTATAVNGLQYSFTYTATSFGGLTSGTAVLYVQMLKNGVAVGTKKNIPVTTDGAAHTVTFGGTTDLWGASVSPGDLIGNSFGFQIYFNLTSAHGPLSATYGFNVTAYDGVATAYVTPASGTSSNSGGGVGVVGGVGGGSINLSLGRTYYLVANNNVSGHFSDLSPASNSTGAASNTNFNLILAKFNDPQVTSKFIVATPDGGDPSILYEVQALVPGLTITSWTISTNVVTFNGTWTGNVYSIGTTFVVGGLSHGSYMNGQTMTVTASTGATIQAAFTHGNDSATEIGIAGNLAFEIPNSVTAVVDNIPDPTLVLAQPLLYTDQFGSEFGVTDNDPPPAGNLLIKHQGRLWMAGVAGATHTVYFTKGIAELTLPNGFVAGKYEECWPLDNTFDVSDGAESVAGFLSDGTSLYIGTQSHIRRLVGNDPTNFQQPAVVHPEVGLINQEVWQIVFMQGAPSGSIWLTPDFRVIQSDFNTYVDIGTSIQDVLNNLQPTAPSLAHAAFVADGEFELYILSVPFRQSTFCDTHLVYDLRNHMWAVWQPAGGSTSLLYNVTQAAIPQWLFIDGASANIFQYAQTATTDNGTAIPVTATTPWMHLGEPTRRKMLNEIQVFGNTGMTMTVSGANKFDEFTSPHTVVYNHTLRLSPFGTWSLYLTNFATKYRYYQLTFQANNGQVQFLGSYAISAIPLDDL